MSLESNLQWLRNHLPANELHCSRVLDIGSRNWDCTLRPWLESQGATVTGVDLEPGPEVDIVADAAYLMEAVEHETWDIVLCIEALEHIQYWKQALQNMKSAVKPGGSILLTTRGPGYLYHGFPHDYWRFSAAILRESFADFCVDAAEDDWLHRGVYLRARKPKPVDLSQMPEAMPVQR